LWEVATFNLVARCGVPLSRNLIKICIGVRVHVCVCVYSEGEVKHFILRVKFICDYNSTRK